MATRSTIERGEIMSLTIDHEELIKNTDTVNKSSDESNFPIATSMQKNSAPKEITSSLENDHPDLINDLKKMNKTELRNKYNGEASCHKNMKSRCKNFGLTLHSDFEDLSSFLSEMGPKPAAEYTLDRINNDLGYSPSNCRWADKKLQTKNRTNTRMIELDDGTTLPIQECSDIYGVPINTIKNRIDNLDWDPNDAVKTPTGQKPVNKNGSLLFSTSRFYQEKTRSLWAGMLREEFDRSFISFSAKDKKMLKDVTSRLEEGGLDPLAVIEFAILNWSTLIESAVNEYGEFGNPPSIPTIAFFSKHLVAAGNLFQINED